MVRPAGISNKIKSGGKGVKAQMLRVANVLFCCPAGTALVAFYNLGGQNGSNLPSPSPFKK